MPVRRDSKYTGRLVVRLAPPVVARIAARAKDPALPDWPGLQELTTALGLDGLRGIFQRYPSLPSYPSVRGTRISRILQREMRARATDFPPPRSLTAYYIVDPREWRDADLAERLLAELNALPKNEVELAYREFGVELPGNWVVDPGDPLVRDQGYLHAAPKGIGAKTKQVWGSFSGKSVGFVDLEAGWNLEHEELPPSAAGAIPIRNVNNPLYADHGTNVLGIVLGQPNGTGITGIAPGADFVGVTSYIASLAPFTIDIAGAIDGAMDVMKRGDVLLLEVETSEGYPIETDEVVFIAITEAVAEGIVVIEAAGNGSSEGAHDLDEPMPWRQGDPPPVDLNRGSPGFQDSGAVMVSACEAGEVSQGGHLRLDFAGYGSRVDCYAWGEKVVTAGGGDLGQAGDPDREYTSSFSGTSSASAIIAGAALLVQEMAVDKRGGRLTPTKMRSTLSDANTGTSILKPQGSTTIGVMPDLRAILAIL